MVYRGKPSNGCLSCRERKVKCDEAKPVCRRCSRGRRPCKGYRDQLSMWFKDQTEETSRKLTLAASNSIRLQALKIPKSKPFGSITFPLEGERIYQATCFFVKSASIFGDSCLLALTPFPETIDQKAMMAGVAAVGLAQLSAINKSPAMMLSAMQEYHRALNLTNLALSEPAQALSDYTLMAIVCLSLYGVTRGKEEKPLDSWHHHWKGVAALIQLRGPGQFRNPSGLQLFQILRHGVMISCLQRRTRIPHVLIEMPGSLDGCINVADRLSQIAFQFCELRADIDTAIVTDCSMVLKRALDIDLQLEHLIANLSPSFSYTTVLCPKDTLFRVGRGNIMHHNGRYHIYQSIEACRLWNNYRLIRILVNELILSQLQPSGAPIFGTRYQTDLITQLMEQLAIDVCYSVWYNIGESMDSNREANRISSVGVHAGFTLLLPLLIAIAVKGAHSPTGIWITDLLDLIGQGNGIEAALLLREYLQKESTGGSTQGKIQSAFGWLDGS
ncbi:unnamed protein product [Penicillium salamii]|nr:unnamed protein product [Penicillium salamii]